MTWFSVLFLFVLSIASTFSARILGIVSTTSYSHQSAYLPLWKELSLRGHQVTILTTDPLRDPTLTNLTEIDCSFSYKTKHRKLNLNELAEVSSTQMIERIISAGYDILEEQLQHSMVQNLLKNETEHFDVVLVEAMYTGGAAFAERFNCPLIQMLSLDAFHCQYHDMGNPSHPVLNPEVMLPFVGKLNFFQRLISVGFSFVMRYYIGLVADSQDVLVKKYFGNDYPHLRETLSKTSMWFVNTNPIFHSVRPLLPNIIQFGGGTHLKAPKPLPKDLQNLLDRATNGIIYFSLGSNVKSKFLSQERLAILMETFAELPYTILWKFEREDLPGKSENVIISKWFPQQDIFRHPNVKLFITQGGLQSIEEAMYNYIPMIGMPFIADQKHNVNILVHKGMGLSLDFATMDKAALKETILEILNNPKYRYKVRELAELVKDQPMTGLERAVWWTEYVIRHKGAEHLRSPAKDLPLYQYFLLDVIGFCLVVILVAIYILIKSISLIGRLLNGILVKTKSKIE
ncbi:hypothetical protein ILUMI_09708 [Ignelater luminosus]|uniref:Glucuronosyltransferase n=1 Tax=Ignelater luminosus TaxID=2038154 RepID=A0A8K0D5A7_IGNLU|nr:hypothetical protein ILUMI_09708 [Ignelater luminosus]